ncbi:MAG: hypothetical protein DSZ23_00870, partial [Thermodesulfatator sp.]
MNLKQLIFLFSFLFLIQTIQVQAVYSAVKKVPDQYPTIQKAIDAASPGDRVLVAAGTYFEHINLKKGVTLQGGWQKNFSMQDVKKYETIIDGAKEKGPVVIGADNAVIYGFTIIHGSLLVEGDSSLGSGIYCKNVSPKIINNIIRDNEPSGIYCSGSKATIKANRIYNNAQAGVYVQKDSRVTVTGNVIYGNKYSGISTGKKPISFIEAINNTIFKNERSGINLNDATGRIYNNIIYDNKNAGIRARHAPLVVANNTVTGNGQSGFTMENPAAVAKVINNIFYMNQEAGIRTAGQGYSSNLLFANGGLGKCNPDFLWCVRFQFGGYEDET